MALVVACEGLSGCGKTTIIEMLMKDLRSQGLRVKMFDIENIEHAPTLRAIAKEYPLDHPGRFMLFWTLRLQQYETICAAQDQFDVIFADRLFGSPIAHDVFGNGVPCEVWDWLLGYFKQRPDITFLFEAPLEVVRQRKDAPTTGDFAFAQRVALGYQKLADEFSWTRVNATQKPEEVKTFCLNAILTVWSEKSNTKGQE